MLILREAQAHNKYNIRSKKSVTKKKTKQKTKLKPNTCHL